MSRFIDRTGIVYSYLTAKRVDKEHRGGLTWWVCECVCGSLVSVRGNGLTAGSNKSCGCMKGTLISKANTKHGLRNHPTYECWRHMLSRCENKKATDYRYYGAKGIKVCKDWHDVTVFIKWASSNGWKPGLTIDRIRSKGNYVPSNCRFITQSENSSRNSGKMKASNTSGYVNICKSKNKKRWIAVATVKKVKTYIGTYDTIKEAIKHRNSAIR